MTLPVPQTISRTDPPASRAIEGNARIARNLSVVIDRVCKLFQIIVIDQVQSLFIFLPDRRQAQP